MKTANDTIIEAIDLLLQAATGEQTGIAETWEASNHATIRAEEAIDIIEADEWPTTPENRILFNAARTALEAIIE